MQALLRQPAVATAVATLLRSQPVAATAAVAALLLALALWYARAATRAVLRVERFSLESDLARLTARAAVAPRGAPLAALVTGANAGIGFTLATLLARCGVRVVLGCRSAARGQAAAERIRAAVGPSADVRLLVLDVSDPGSVLAAAARARTDGALGLTGGLHLLFLNAGVMPLSRYRWEVVLQALLTGRLGHFLTTGRAGPHAAHFLGQPQDELGAAGAPATFATNVLGHLLLVQELQPLLVAAAAAAAGGSGSSSGSSSSSGGGATVVWTGSRAATASKLVWEHLQAPPAVGAPSSHALWLSTGQRVLGEAYGESKYATDLLNAALAKRLAPQRVRTLVVCPGFIDTDITPPFFKAFIPAMRLIRGVTEGFNIEPTLGALVSIKAALNADSLRPDVKYVLRAGQLVPAARGAPMHALTSRGGGVAEADQERMWALCNEWMHVWRAHAALNGASQAPRVTVAAAPSGGAAPLASTAAASGDAASTGKSSSAASRRRKASIAA